MTSLGHNELRFQLGLTVSIVVDDAFMHMCTLVRACGLKAVNKESESESESVVAAAAAAAAADDDDDGSGGGEVETDINRKN